MLFEITADVHPIRPFYCTILLPAISCVSHIAHHSNSRSSPHCQSAEAATNLNQKKKKMAVVCIVSQSRLQLQHTATVVIFLVSLAGSLGSRSRCQFQFHRDGSGGGAEFISRRLRALFLYVLFIGIRVQ